MCRHLAYVGRPRTIASLVIEPPHSLNTQSYAPRRQTRVRMNADGWGIGFYTPGESEPARWRSTQPMWSHHSYHSVAPRLVSGAFLAAVRAASPGMPIEESATAPFTDGRWLMSHNGEVDPAVLPAGHDAESVCDAAILAAHVFASDPSRLAQTVAAVGEKDPNARLNVLLCDGERILATTWGDTLSYLVLDGGIVVSSEPYDDDPRWVDVADRCLLQIDSASVHITNLES